MHARRLLPDHLIALALCAGAAGCVSDRYVGSVGKTGTYANRGYGMTMRLDSEALSSRWKVIDPRAPETAPAGLEIEVKNEALDLDADGLLHMDETVLHNRPTLRLFAKSSTIGPVWIDVDVSILSGKDATHSLDSWMAHEMKQLTGSAGTTDQWQARRLAPDFDGRVAEVRGARAYRLALIDHVAFESEDGVPRRQLIRVLLVASKITKRLRADHDHVLDAISLNQQAGRPSKLEKF